MDCRDDSWRCAIVEHQISVFLYAKLPVVRRLAATNSAVTRAFWYPTFHDYESMVDPESKIFAFQIELFEVSRDRQVRTPLDLGKLRNRLEHLSTAW
jgi:hypothetical protein